MGKSSGGVRTSNNVGGGNYTASVAVINKNDQTRILQKNFRTQTAAERWIDSVANKFDSPAKSGFAQWASIDKETKKGTEYDVYNRDLAREFEAKDKRAFRSGQGSYTGTIRKRKK